MIINVSGRTDIVAFYTPWFMNRYREGFVDVRNPFNYKDVSRIYFEDVDLIFFCTKNPMPIIKYLKEIKHKIEFNVTLTPYKNDIEPNVPDKRKIIESIKAISKIIGADNIAIRYDPIFLNDKYNLEYHKKAFSKLCKILNGYVKRIIVSFIDEYKNVFKNKKILNYKTFTLDDYKEIGLSFSKSAKENDITVQTCFEENNLTEYGFIKDDCLSCTRAFKITGKIIPKGNIRKGNLCSCVKMVDIGVYNSCRHFCKYCYANFDENKVNENVLKHNPNSSLLIGELSENDIIRRKSD